MHVTGKVSSGLRVEYAALCWLGEREGEEESAIDCQANTSQPLSPSFSIVSEHETSANGRNLRRGRTAT